MQRKSPTRLAFSMEETMDALDLSRPTLYGEINKGRLRTYCVGRRRFCTPDAVRDYQHLCESETTPPGRA